MRLEPGEKLVELESKKQTDDWDVGTSSTPLYLDNQYWKVPE